MPLTFLRWTILDQLASSTDHVVSLSDDTDKQTFWLVNVTFDWRQILTTAVQRYGRTCWLITFLCRYFTQLHGSKVSRESDLHSVPYNRPVGIRSFVKNVKSLSETQHNSWTVQDNLMKLHMLTQLVKMCVVGKDENSCSLRFLDICPLI